MNWVDPNTPEGRKFLAEKRAAYTWDQLARELALNTWVEYGEALRICECLQKLNIHPYDAQTPARQIISAVVYGSNVTWMLDAILAMVGEEQP